MFHLIAQTTQPDMTVWSPAAVTAVIGAVVTGLVTIAAAVGGLIVAWKSNTKATEAKAGTEAAQKSIDRFSARQNAVETKVTDMALKTPTTPEKPL